MRDGCQLLTDLGRERRVCGMARSGIRLAQGNHAGNHGSKGSHGYRRGPQMRVEGVER
jgi:hypothetical protein